MMDNINKQFEEKWNNTDVKNIMNKVSNRYVKNIDMDDLESIKMNTLWKCIEKYDSDKGTKFTSYLYQQLTFALKNQIKKKRKEFNSQRTLEKMDVNQMMYQEVYDIITGLEEEDTKILEQRFYHNMTMKEIGRQNGYSRETARRRLKNAVKLCQNICEVG
jgi:RNA polymerase sigma factor (sigma-70 family)